jgi:hypothetical protein
MKGSSWMVCMAVAVVCGLLTSPMPADAAAFPLQGRYNIILSGVSVLDPDADGPAGPVTVGTSSVGTMRATRSGNIRGVKNTFNIGGCLILSQSGSGSYSSAGAIGTARVTLTVVDVRQGEDNACGPVLALANNVPDTVTYEFDFVVNQKRNNSNQIVDIVGVRLLDESGTIPLLGFESHGVARPVN